MKYLLMGIGMVASLAACSNRSTVGSAQVAVRVGGRVSVTRSLACEHSPAAASVPALSERARKGLAIDPACVPLAGLGVAELEAVGMGSYLVNAGGSCAGCHTGPSQQFLGGGTPFPFDAEQHLVYSRSLRPDVETGRMRLTETQFIESLRTGKDQRPGATKMLLVMPWPTFRWMSDADLQAIYAYLSRLPPLLDTVPADDKSSAPAPASVPFSGQYDEGDEVRDLPCAHGDTDNVQRGLAIQPLRATSVAKAERDKFGRGSYLANAVADCNGCHTNPDRDYTSPHLRVLTDRYLTGGLVFVTPPPLNGILHQARSMSANLIGDAQGFFDGSEGHDIAAFVRGIRTGTHPDDAAAPLAWPMPWDFFKNLTDYDLEALGLYVLRMPRISGPADKITQDMTTYCDDTSGCDTAAGQTCENHECVGQACTFDAAAPLSPDCGACQTCGAGKTCSAPAADSTCVALGIR